MKAKLKRAVLLALLSYEGKAFPEGALVAAAQMSLQPAHPTEDDVLDALKDCRAAGLVMGVTDEFSQERSWSLTTDGIHQARKLRP